MVFFDREKDKDQPEDVSTVIATKRAVVPKETEANLKFTQELMRALGTNNTELILQAVDVYNDKFEANNARRIRMEPYATNIKNFHTRLVNSIDGSKKIDGLNSDERISALGKMPELQDATRTFNTMKKYITKEVNELKTSVVTDSVVAGNSEIKGTIETIFDKFSDLKTRNMFFEYKYIQMYLFMSVFVQHVYNTMDKFIVDVIAINELKDQYRQESYKQIFDKLLKMFEVQGDSLNLKIENTDEFFNNLSKGMEKKMEDVKKSYDAAAKASMDDILRFILENENSMTKSLMQLVRDKNSGVERKQPFDGESSATPTGSVSLEDLAKQMQNATPSSSEIKTDGPRVQLQGSLSLEDVANHLEKETSASPKTAKQMQNATSSEIKTGGQPVELEGRYSLEDVANQLRTIKKGGFIRSGSTFPQSFYQTNSKSGGGKPQVFSAL